MKLSYRKCFFLLKMILRSCYLFSLFTLIKWRSFTKPNNSKKSRVVGPLSLCSHFRGFFLTERRSLFTQGGHILCYFLSKMRKKLGWLRSWSWPKRETGSDKKWKRARTGQLPHVFLFDPNRATQLNRDDVTPLEPPLAKSESDSGELLYSNLFILKISALSWPKSLKLFDKESLFSQFSNRNRPVYRLK